MKFRVGDKFIKQNDGYEFLDNAVITKIIGDRIEFKPANRERQERDWCSIRAITNIIVKDKEVKLVSGKITDWKERIK